MTSRKFKLRKILGNRAFLDYDPKEFWGSRPDGRGIGNEPWLKDLAEFLKENGCKTLLEIGCGNGCNLAYAKKEIPNLECIGFDLSQRHISQGTTKYPNIKLTTKELKNWQPDQKFDCVLTAGILMHVPPKNIKETIQKIKETTNLIFCYEPISEKYGLRHPNNFVFFYDYNALFGEDMKQVFRKKYEGEHAARAFKKKEG